MAARADLLAASPLFSHLSPKTLETIARPMAERTFPAGAEIVTEGEGGIGFFVITAGKAEVVHPGENAPRATLGPGAAFGEIALLDGGPRSATVRAATAVTCLILTRWDFLAALRSDAEMGVELAEAMAKRIRDLEARISELEKGNG